MRMKIPIRAAPLLSLLIVLCHETLSTEFCNDGPSRLQCLGRCAAASKHQDIEYQSCINLCCDMSAGNDLPSGCPLHRFNANCSSSSSTGASISIQSGQGVLNIPSASLDQGIALCPGNATPSVDNDTVVVFLEAVHMDSGLTVHQLFVAGKENVLHLNSSECYHIIVYALNECGESTPLVNTAFPEDTDLLSSAIGIGGTVVEDLLPKVTISWTFNGSPALNPVFQVSMVPLGTNMGLTCPPYSGSFHGARNHVDLYSEDFNNASVWLCFYKIEVSVKYGTPCHELLTESTRTAETQITQGGRISDLINITDETLIWNHVTLKYSMKLAWTVPQLYNLTHLLDGFAISLTIVGSSHIPDITTRNNVDAVPGQEFYEVILYNDSLAPGQSRCFNMIAFAYVGVGGLPTLRKSGCIPGDAQPPPAATNITVLETADNLVITWNKPAIPTAPLIFALTVQFYGENDIKVVTLSKQNIVNTSYLLPLDDIPMLTVRMSFVVTTSSSVASNPSSPHLYTYNATFLDRGLHGPGNHEQIGLIVGMIGACLLVIVALMISMMIVVGCLRRRRLWPDKGCAMDPILHPSQHDYQMYFKRLPPAMVDRWVIPLHMFKSETFHLLGEGNFSSVYFSVVNGPLSTPTKLERFKNYVELSVAVKILKGNSAEQEMEAFLNEAEVLKTLSSQSCPYVVQLVGLQLEHAPPMIAMELVACGNLLEILRSSALAEEGSDSESVFSNTIPSSKKLLKKTDTQLTLIEFQKERAGSIDSYVQLKALSICNEDIVDVGTEPKVAIKASQLMKFAIQAVRGMEHLQTFGILHRDLACRNLLLSANGIVKISDFGFACFLNGQSQVVSQLPTDSKPLRWMSPEAFEQDTFSAASDVWSFGVTLWELFNQGKFPYPTLSDGVVMEAVKSGQFLECPEKCDEKVYNLMLNCWMLAPHDRPTFSSLKTAFEGFMYDLYPYMLMEVQEEPGE